MSKENLPKLGESFSVEDISEGHIYSLITLKKDHVKR